MTTRKLIINGDDFGSSESSNRGVIRAFTQGVLTSSNLMAPCAWFPQAARLAKEHKLPCGVHLTLTCEYTQYQFGPLTRSPQLSRDGKGHTFYLSSSDIPKDANEAIYLELAAQIERCLDHGIALTYMDSHMVSVPRWDNAFRPAVERLYEKYRIPFRQYDKQSPVRSLPVEHHGGLGKGPKEQPLKERVRNQLRELPPGITYLLCHPAEMSLEMTAMECHPGFAQTRADELALLLDPEVRGWLTEFGIELITVPQAVSAASS